MLDKWILSKTERLTEKVTDALEKCQFNVALEETRSFTWHTFCDCYLEAVKDRLYRPERYGEEKKKAAQYTLHRVLERIVLLLAPIVPHVTEELYSALYAEDRQTSIHRLAWPRVDKTIVDEAVEKQGELIMAIITEVRKEKAEKHLPLNAQVKKLTVYAEGKDTAEAINQGREDIEGTCKVTEMQILSQEGVGRKIEPYGISFISEF